MNALRFVGAMVATLAILSLAGWALASAFLPKPVRYFHTSYMEFAIPDRWYCHREGTEFLCEPRERPPDGLRAIMIVGAKLRGAMDDRDAYIEHLRTPRVVRGGERMSVVEEVSTFETQGREWVFGAQFESEIPKFRTRYYVSYTDTLAAAVTFTTHESIEGRYDEDVVILLESLKLFDARDLR